MHIRYYPPNLSDDDVGKLMSTASRYCKRCPKFCNQLRVFCGYEILRRWALRHDKAPREVRLLEMPLNLSDCEVGQALLLVEAWSSALHASAELLELVDAIHVRLLVSATKRLSSS